MNNQHICIYHKNCADGFGAALAVKHHWDAHGVPESSREFVPAHYGDTPPDVNGKNVTIVDFSYPRETLLQMYKTAESILVIDHHKTARENLDGIDFCIFDMEQSGAMLAWKALSPLCHSEGVMEKSETFNVPGLIKYIQDRDLWEWKLPQSKEVSAALQSLPMTFEDWEPYLNNDNIADLKIQGEAILRYQEQQIAKIVNSKLPMTELAGYTVPCINTTTLISEIGNEISKGYPFAVMYFDTEDKRVYSLRSAEDGVDVSEIAKLFGGGGHKHAAGFSVQYNEPHNLNTPIKKQNTPIT